MLNSIARWVWVLIPIVVAAGVVLVIVSPDPSGALWDLIWVAAVIALLLYVSISSRRKKPGPQRDDSAPHEPSSKNEDA